MDPINVVITHSFPDNLLEKITAVSPRLNVIVHPATAHDDLGDAAADAHVLYGSRLLPEPASAPELRWVQLHSAGVDRLLDHPLYQDTDVIFTTTSGIHAVSVGEYVMAQVLAFSHHLPRMFQDKQDANWPEDRWARYLPRELRGATIGIVGYGSIGREIARLASCFGMNVLAIKRNVRQLADTAYTVPGTGDPQAEIPERIYPIQALRSFASECDYLVLTVPLTEETHHLVNAAVLDAMKPTGVLINISRGGVVDQAALIAALERGKPLGAALDVFEEEPLPAESPLWALPNVMISPHISGIGPRYDDLATDVFAENLRRYIAGEPLLNVVDRSRGY